MIGLNLTMKKRYLQRAILLFALLLGSSGGSASDNVTAKWAAADATVRQLFELRAALFSFYDRNQAWPVAIETLADANNPYYGGRFETPYNTRVSGAISAEGQFYLFSLDVGRAELAEYIARQLNATSAGNQVTFKVGVPATHALFNGFLNREVVAGHPELNEMATDLSLGSFDIDAVGTVNATAINVGTATVSELNVTGIAQLIGGINSTHMTAQTLTTTGTITASGELDARGGIKSTGIETQSLNVSNSTILNGTELNGTTVVKGTLDAQGIANFIGKVNFAEEVIFARPVQSDVITAQTASVGTLRVTGDQTVSGNLAVGVKTTTPLIEAANATVSQRLTAAELVVNGRQTVNGTQIINGNSQVSGTQTVGALVVNGATVLGQTTINNTLVINASQTNADTLTLMKGVRFVDGNTGIDKGNNDALRLKTRSAWLDIGHFDAGWVTIDTNQNGVKFNQAVQTPNLTVLGSGDREVTIRSVNGGQAIVTFSNDATIADAQLILTDDNTLALQNARFNANAGLVVNGGAATFNSGATFNTDVTVTQSVFARRFVENGMALSDSYLGVGATAANAERLDGVDGLAFARRDLINYFDDWQRFSRDITVVGVTQADGGLKVDGRWVVSADGGTLSENGQPLAQRYLGLNAKAVDADKVDGIDGYQLARRDQGNTFTGANQFTQPLRVATSTGRVEIGSQDARFTHFTSTNPGFYFNQPIEAESSLGVYNSAAVIGEINMPGFKGLAAILKK
jgi:hypothetical protein